jgi:hypothetical protein
MTSRSVSQEFGAKIILQIGPYPSSQFWRCILESVVWPPPWPKDLGSCYQTNPGVKPYELQATPLLPMNRRDWISSSRKTSWVDTFTCWSLQWHPPSSSSRRRMTCFASSRTIGHWTHSQSKIDTPYSLFRSWWTNYAVRNTSRNSMSDGDTTMCIWKRAMSGRWHFVWTEAFLNCW